MTKIKKLILIGAGEFAEIAYEYFTYDSQYEVVGFSVEREYITKSVLHDKPIVAFEEITEHFSPQSHDVFVAIPATQLNKLRTRFYQAVKQKGYMCATYISSHAFVWRNAHIGENTFIFEKNVIQPFVVIGNNVILWSGNHIGHRTIIEDNCFLSSHVVVSGYCRIGEGSFVGVNATFNDHVEIPHDCVIASSTLINKNLLQPGKVYCGTPAKIIAKKSAYDVTL